MPDELSYVPLPKQFLFHKAKQRFRAFVGGIGSGKTIAGVHEVIRYCMKNPGCYGMITAPTYPMLRDATKRTFFEECPDHLIKEYLKGENKVILINDAVILFRSVDDPERLRGPNLAFWFGDEAAMYPYMVWKIMIGRLRQKGYVAKAWITTTSKGFNWIWNLFVKEPDLDNYFLVMCSTRENTYLPEDYIVSMEKEYTGVFYDQELLGKFVGFEGLVYSEFRREVHVMELEPAKDEDGWYLKSGDKEIRISRWLGCIDFGFNNPNVFLLVAEDHDSRLYIVREFYEKNVVIDEFARVVKEYEDEYDLEYVYADPSAKEEIFKMSNSGIPIYKSDNEVLLGISKVSGYIKIQKDGKPKLYVGGRCLNTAMEFENYRYGEVKEGKPVQENPLKIYDHAMDAIRYLILSVESEGFLPLEDPKNILGLH